MEPPPPRYDYDNDYDYDYDYPSLIGVKNLKILRKVGDPRPGGPLGTLYNRFRA